MDSIRKAVLDSRVEAKDDKDLVYRLNILADKHGNVIHQAIFHIYAGLDLPGETAQRYWLEVLHHRKSMITLLGRNTSLLVSMCDYLISTKQHLMNPRLIEETSYAKVIMETTHDGLTNLFNRQYFNESFEHILSAANRYNTDVTLLFLDIDNFKEVNDTYGHSCGDLALQYLSDIIKEEKRDSDIAARFGGEEFVLLMPHTESINGFILAERIRKRVENLSITECSEPFSFTISGGLASFPQNAKTPATLLNSADSALYLAKGAGKNIISMYKQEKRRYLRVKYTEPVKIKELGFDSSPIFDGTSKDICIGGILFENNVSLPIGARIQVSIPIKGETPLLLIGTVVRVEAYSNDLYDIGMTISFKEMEKIANTEISNFLKNNISTTAE